MGPGPDGRRFPGRYRLLEATLVECGGARKQPLGAAPTGRLHYGADGTMWALLAPSGRRAVPDVATATEADLRQMVHGVVAYYATYFVDERMGTVTHRVNAALDPGTVGRQLVREYTFVGDTLTLTIRKVEYTITLRFERVGSGVIVTGSHLVQAEGKDAAARPLNHIEGDWRKPAPVIWLTGLSGAGKSTIGRALVDNIRVRGIPVECLDGDVLRGIFPTTGFSREAREAHVKWTGYSASLLAGHGVTVVCALISPYAAGRAAVRRLCERFVEVYVSTPIEECERRDVKGLYARARRGELLNFTGISDPYERPMTPEVTVDTRSVNVDLAVEMIVAALWGTDRVSVINTE
jgi:adenylylsulfate kinase